MKNEIVYCIISFLWFGGGSEKIETLRLRFGDLTTNGKPRFAVSSFTLAVCPYPNSWLPFLFSFVRLLLLYVRNRLQN